MNGGFFRLSDRFFVFIFNKAQSANFIGISISIMAFYNPSFKPIPEKTARRVKTLFGKSNMYLRLGNQVDELFTDLFSQDRIMADTSTCESVCLLFLISAIQYEEELPDLRFIKALSGRMEIKYALHLPEDYPSIDAVWLSGFRQQLLSSPIDLHSFQEFLDRLKKIGLLCQNPEKSSDAKIVLKTIMIASLVERVVEAMYLLLEKLAIENYEWLRSIILPQWYERYSRTKGIMLWPDFKNNWRSLPQAIGQDLHYLLDKIDKSPVHITEGLSTVLILRQSWEDLYEAMETNNFQSLTFKANPGE